MMSLRDQKAQRLHCALANYMILTGIDESSYPELPTPDTPWMMETRSRDEIINSDSPHECRAGDKVIAGCDCWNEGDDFEQFKEDQGGFLKLQCIV